jgi:hypothetical protein
MWRQAPCRVRRFLRHFLSATVINTANEHRFRISENPNASRVFCVFCCCPDVFRRVVRDGKRARDRSVPELLEASPLERPVDHRGGSG